MVTLASVFIHHSATMSSPDSKPFPAIGSMPACLHSVFGSFSEAPESTFGVASGLANASLFGAAVYTIAPYHVNQIYNAFTYAEFAAAGVLPFCFLFAERICKRRDWISSVGFAISFALLL